jgi:multidrug efflux system membrane fusion protein
MRKRAIFRRRARFCAIAAALMACACQPDKASSPQAAANAPAPAVPVVVERAQRTDFAISVSAIGWVESYARVVVRPQVSGKLESLHFTEGQDVKRGQLLATIDPRPFEAALQLAEANRARDAALAENAEAEAVRIADLFKRGQASDRERDDARFTAESRRAQVRAIEAEIARARINLEYCSIHAPLDGRAGARMLDPGNVVEENKTDLLTINQISPIFVRFSVPEQYLPQVQDALANGTGTVSVQVDGAGIEFETGTLTFVDNQVDITTGMIPLKATFENKAGRLWPGQFVRTTLNLATHRDAVVVPAAAVQPGQDRPYVYVVGPDDTVELRRVTPGLTIAGRTVISEGLSGNEEVVTDGHLRLTPGAKIARRSFGTGSQPEAATSAPADETGPAETPGADSRAAVEGTAR